MFRKDLNSQHTLTFNVGLTMEHLDVLFWNLKVHLIIMYKIIQFF